MIKLSHFTALAQELVDASSALLGNRTVNIMDLDGIIIASSEKNRIGTRHAGAEYVAKSKEELAITRENVKKYPGAKEGYNMPLICNGEMIGVIGMFGNPDEVRELAMLLKVYAVKYFELETTISETLQDAAVKSSFFEFLGGVWDEESQNRFDNFTEQLNIRFRYPVYAVRIRRVIRNSENRSNHWGLEILEREMLDRGMLQPKHDIWSFDQDTLCILKSIGTGSAEEYKANLKELVGTVQFPVEIFLSEKANSQNAVGKAYRQAFQASIYLSGPFLDMSQEETRMDFIMGETAFLHREVLDGYIQKLREDFHEDELRVLLRSMECYYKNDKSIGQAAADLFIHKNTVQYRVKKLREAAGIHGKSPFFQDYLMKLILLRFRQTGV